MKAERKNRESIIRNEENQNEEIWKYLEEHESLEELQRK